MVQVGSMNIFFLSDEQFFAGMFQVCAPSCHDCSTLRAWWEEDEGRRSRFYKTVVGSDEEPPSRCTPEVVHFIVQQHFDAPSMWAIFPLQVNNLY